MKSPISQQPTKIAFSKHAEQCSLQQFLKTQHASEVATHDQTKQSLQLQYSSLWRSRLVCSEYCHVWYVNILVVFCVVSFQRNVCD